MIRYLLFWLPLPFIAISNGVIRELFIVRYVDDFAAHQLSSLSLILLFGVYGLIIIGKLNVRNGKDALVCGFIWFNLTILFESGLGLWIQKKPLIELLNEYNILEGKLWLLIVLFTAFLPYFLYIFKRGRRIFQVSH